MLGRYWPSCSCAAAELEGSHSRLRKEETDAADGRVPRGKRMTLPQMSSPTTPAPAGALWRAARKQVAKLADVLRGRARHPTSALPTTSEPEDQPAREEPQHPPQRGGLFRKYAALLVALVGGSLIVSAAIEMYYSWGESRQALIAVQ